MQYRAAPPGGERRLSAAGRTGRGAVLPEVAQLSTDPLPTRPILHPSVDGKCPVPEVFIPGEISGSVSTEPSASQRHPISPSLPPKTLLPLQSSTPNVSDNFP